MSAPVINLRQVRKAKARAEKSERAEENRRQFGRTKAEKLKQSADKSKAEQHLDAHKRDR